MIGALKNSEILNVTVTILGQSHSDSHEVALPFPLASVTGSVCVSVSPRKLVLSCFVGYLRCVLTYSVGKKCVDRGLNTRDVTQTLTVRTVLRRKITRYLIS